MKKVIMFLCALTLVLGVVGTASAVPYTWTDTYDDRPIHFSNDGVQSYSFRHDITDHGFDPGEDLVTTYGISMSFLYDEVDVSKSVHIDLPGFWSDRRVEINYSDINLGMSLMGWVQLNIFGFLDITLNRISGDFLFADSTLTAHGDESNVADATAAPVPEPSTILLMGTGILGLVAYGRKRYHKQA